MCPPFPADEAAAVAAMFNDNPSYIEPTLHAVGHEYWTNGQMSRAEWYDRQGFMRDDTQRHLDAFLGIYSDAGFRQPLESYIPAAFLHRFGDDGKGLAGILKQAGIRHISTPYKTMFHSRPTEYPLFGVEDGLMTVDRGHDLAPWHAIGPSPSGHVAGPICGLHWPNLLHQDPSRSAEVVDRWVNLLTPYDSMPDRTLSGNTRDCWTQLAHHSTVSVEVRGCFARNGGKGLPPSITNGLEGANPLAPGASGQGQVVFDFTKLNRLSTTAIDRTFEVKIQSDRPLVVTSPDMTIEEANRIPTAGMMRLKVSRKDARQSKGIMEFITRSS